MKKFVFFFFLLGVFVADQVSANVVGAGTQNFNPTTDGLDFVTVHSADTLEPGIINLGGFFNFAANSLPYVASNVQSRIDWNDTLTSLDFNVGIGILPRLAAGLSFPVVLYQTVEEQTGVRGQFADQGNTEVRLNSKYQLARWSSVALATVATVNFPRTRNDPYAGADPGPTFNLELVADKAWTRKLASAVNLGYRHRQSGEPIPNSFIEPMRDQWILSLAASYLFEGTDTKVIGEIFGAAPARSEADNPARNMTSAELLVGVKHDWTPSLALHFGAGTEIVQGVSSPDWRIYSGLNYVFGPVWRSRPGLRARGESDRSAQKFSVGSILFKFDSAEMVNDYPTILAELVREIRRGSFRKLRIEGHTDSVGSVAYNNDLSLRRANAIRDYLVRNEKVDPAKIETFGHGPSQPIASNGNYQGRQANRRVEFTIFR